MPNSLHAIGPQNQYFTAISQVGAVLEPYDYNKMFPTFGFGGIPEPGQGVSHNFPLNSNPQQPAVLGTQGILDVY